jgi:hypothetical protein
MIYENTKTAYLPISGDFILDKDEHDVGTFIQVQRFVNVQQHLPGIEKKSSEQLLIKSPLIGKYIG